MRLPDCWEDDFHWASEGACRPFILQKTRWADQVILLAVGAEGCWAGGMDCRLRASRRGSDARDMSRTIGISG